MTYATLPAATLANLRRGIMSAGLTLVIHLITLTGGNRRPPVVMNASVTAQADDQEHQDSRGRQIRTRTITLRPMTTTTLSVQMGDIVVMPDGLEYTIERITGGDVPRWECVRRDQISVQGADAFRAIGG